MSAQVLTNQTSTLQQWFAKLTSCQEQILQMQTELLDALPTGASVTFLSKLNEHRETLIKNLEQIDNFRYKLILQDREKHQSDPEATRKLQDEIQAFLNNFNQQVDQFQAFIA